MFEIDFNKDLKPITLVLCKPDKEPICIINPVDDFKFSFKENDADEISFSFSLANRNNLSDNDSYKKEIYENLTDFKLVHIPEWSMYYQIGVSTQESDGICVKSCTGISLCEAELSQLMLYNIEINTKEDIDRDDYEITYVYNTNPKQSLIHRILADKAPNYTIAHVSDSLKNLVRSFSINEQSINDFLRGTLSQEINCVVVYDHMNRTISLYDTMRVCNECGHRWETMEEVCPECGSDDWDCEYGEDTGIFITAKNLAQSINVDTNKDEVKTCFKVSGGDDLITNTVGAVLPTGGNYIYNFSNEFLADMPDELVSKINDYQELYNELQPTYESYMEDIYDLIDELQYYQTTMMPNVEPEDTTAAQELAKITAATLGYIGVNNLSSDTSLTVVRNSVLSMAKIYMKMGYSVEVVKNSDSFSVSGNNGTWSGKFHVWIGDPTDPSKSDQATSATAVTINLNNDYATFVNNKLDKALWEDKVFNLSHQWSLYSLDELTNFWNAFHSCLNIIVGQRDNAELGHITILDNLYEQYYSELLSIESEMAVRQATINELIEEKDAKTILKNAIIAQLNFEQYLGDELLSTFVSYRRDDSYNNANYISEGINTGLLSNADLLYRAKELVQKASTELYKSSQFKYTISSSIGNFLLLDEFQDLRTGFAVGNWGFIQTDNGDVYKLRINEISGSYNSLNEIAVSFSNSYKFHSNIAGFLTDTVRKAAQMATSYSYTQSQASQGSEALSELENARRNGLKASNYRIINADNQNFVIDSHGILGREYDDITDDYTDEQVKIINNLICFTDDKWEHTKMALGKQSYTLNGVTYGGFGVNSDFVFAGTVIGSTIIGGEIKSPNYVANTTGSKFDMTTGYFDLGGGSLIYNSNGLTIVGDGDGITNINGSNIQTGSVTANQIGANAITSSKIDAGAITTDKLDAEAVTAEKIKAGTITTDRLSFTPVDNDDFTAPTIVAKINNGSSDLIISASHIELDGNVVLKGDLNTSSGDVSIHGSHIKTGTISTSKLTFEPIINNTGYDTDDQLANVIVSMINDGGGNLRINANKLTVTGDFVVENQLVDGTTMISGDNILTGTIEGNGFALGIEDGASSEIGGFTINSTQIKGINSSGYVTALQSSGNIAFVSGASSDTSSGWNSAPFRVTHNGTLYASDAYISGEITADSGLIGGLEIDEHGYLHWYGDEGEFATYISDDEICSLKVSCATIRSIDPKGIYGEVEVAPIYLHIKDQYNEDHFYCVMGKQLN